VDQRDAALSEAGDLILPIGSGAISSQHILAEMGELVTGSKRGRTSPADITLFKSVGLGIQDCATSWLAYSKALELGVGTQVQITLF
jgi:ornithine cyclodeaminase/alanine dehydrogenase-like protein (mu-crystallin family)